MQRGPPICINQVKYCFMIFIYLHHTFTHILPGYTYKLTPFRLTNMCVKVHAVRRLDIWDISTSWIVSMKRNSCRIRALSWYLIIPYQSNNNNNDHLTRPREGPWLNVWVSTYRYPRSSNNYWYGKSEVRITGDFFFVDLRKKLHSLTDFYKELSIWIIIHDATKSRIICLTRAEGLLWSNSQFLMNRTQQKDSEARRLIKPRPARTIPNQNEPKPLFEAGHCHARLLLVIRQ